MSEQRREGGLVFEANTPVFNLTRDEQGRTIIELGEDGEVQFNPVQQDVVFSIAAKRYKEGLRGEALKAGIISDLKADMEKRA